MRYALVLLLTLGACSGEPEASETATSEIACEGASNPEMVWIEGGRFTLGENPRYPEEGPPREVEVDGFWMSRTEVTNAQFAEFVEETGYTTRAERPPPALPGAPPELLQPGSAVFRVPTPDNPNWWTWMPGAMWQQPSGPGSSIAGRGNDPVVQVTFEDAEAYASWAGVSLPSEEQWEYAARAGSPVLPEPVDEAGNAVANYYQGVFPARDLGEDGFTSRAPAGCFEPNAFGLHDMIGNVWEWTTGGSGSASEGALPTRIIKGGSFLCAANYCARYRPAARQYQEIDLGTDHIGFRVVDMARPAPAD